LTKRDLWAGQEVAMMGAIDGGDIEVQGGTKQDVQKFFGYFDEPVDVGSIDPIVR
jgi:hypothetical protein